MNEFFVRSYWISLRKIINKSSFAALSLTALTSYFIFCMGEYTTDFTFLSISKATWVAVTASVLASTLFYFIQSLINFLKEGEKCTYKDAYDNIIDGFGVKAIYDQRGSSEIQEAYRQRVESCSKMIWAFGMTNRHFIDQHFTKIGELLRDKDIDCLIAFWNPSAFLDDQSSGSRKNILEIQQNLESNLTSDADWKTSIEVLQGRVIERIQKLLPIKGKVKIANVTTPSNFSCLIIDDDVFFFPFLAGPESTNDPMLLCSTKVGIGKAVLSHFRKLVSDTEVVELVYES